MNKNLTEKLKALSAELVEARANGADEETIFQIEDEIWDLEEEIEALLQQEYDDLHNSEFD